jgi:hypothetical protein
MKPDIPSLSGTASIQNAGRVFGFREFRSKSVKHPDTNSSFQRTYIRPDATFAGSVFAWKKAERQSLIG